MNTRFLIVVAFALLPLITNGQAAKQTSKTDTGKKKFVKLPDSDYNIDPSYVTKLLDQKLSLLREDISLLIQKKSKDLPQVVFNTFKLWNYDKSKTVSVTSTKDQGYKAKKHILDYLNGIKQLPYQDAEIKYGQYSLIGRIKKGPDGKYHGVVEFMQEFTATTKVENKLGKKIDKFSKGKIEVIIEAVDYIDKGGVEKRVYELFLGDMAIKETR